MMRSRFHLWSTLHRGVARPGLLLTLLAIGACGTDPVRPPGNGNGDPQPPRVTTVTIAPAANEIKVGDRLAVVAEIRDQYGAVMSGPTPTWTSSLASIATVNGSGMTATVTAVAVGSASILATVNGVTGSASVSVVPPAVVTPVALVRCAPAAITLAIGQTAALQHTAYDAAGNVLANRAATWTTSAAGVVTVSNGVVTAVAAGVASVTVTIDGRSATCVVTVAPAVNQATLVITNQLIAAVSISVQGQQVGIVPAQATRQATITSAPTLDVTFEVIEPQLGGRLLGDRMSGRWTLTAPVGTVNLNIDNLIGGEWYFAPLVTNLTGTPLLMAVNFGLQSENRCRCVVPVGGQRVFLGYYRLFSNSMLHAFADGSGYTGAYRYFQNFGTQIARGAGVREFTYSVFP